MSSLITISDSTHQHDHVNKMGMRGYVQKMWDTPTIKGVDSGQQEQVGSAKKNNQHTEQQTGGCIL
jgi:hypothetical protein